MADRNLDLINASLSRRSFLGLFGAAGLTLGLVA